MVIKRKNGDSDNRLGSIDILVLAFGAMIGWGWVVSSGQWITNAGVLGTIIGFIIAGIMIYFIGLVYGELTTMFPQYGSCLLFSYKAFGPLVSYICSWSMVLGYVGVVCFEACSLPTIVAYIYPSFLQGYLYTIGGFDVYASWLLLAIVVAVIITIVNIRGIKTASIFQNILTLIIALVGFVLIISSTLGGSYFNLSNQLLIGQDVYYAVQNIISIAVIAPFFLFGFDVIPQAIEEINVDLKKIGKILVMSIFLAVSFYGLVVLAIGLSMNYSEIGSSLASNGLVAADAMKKMFNSDVMAKVLVLGGLCGIITSWNSFLIGGSRALYAMSMSRMIPSCLGKLDAKTKTPINAILLIGVLSAVAPLFGKEMLNWIANCSSFACCISYFIVSLSFLKLRIKFPLIERPFCIKKWKIVGFTAVLMSGFMVLMFLIPNMSSCLCFEELIIVIIWFSLGLLFYFYSKYKYKYKNEFCEYLEGSEVNDET